MKQWTRWMPIVLIILAIGLIARGQPSFEMKWNRLASQFQPVLDARSVFIDPGELLQLVYDHGITLTILDVRPESDFNVFHLTDAVRGELEQLDQFHWSELPSNAVVVVMSNDERDAVEAWKRLKLLHVTNAYILEGGANGWLAAFADPAEVKRMDVAQTAAGKQSETMQFRFTSAIGGRHPVSRPDEDAAKERSFEKKVQSKSQARKSGGCG